MWTEFFGDQQGRPEFYLLYSNHLPPVLLQEARNCTFPFSVCLCLIAFSSLFVWLGFVFLSFHLYMLSYTTVSLLSFTILFSQHQYAHLLCVSFHFSNPLPPHPHSTFLVLHSSSSTSLTLLSAKKADRHVTEIAFRC